MKVDLNAPAFGQGAQRVAEAEAEETKVTPQEEVKPVVEETKEAYEEESKVPYSRFKKFHDRALEAEEEATRWREEAERLRQPEEKTLAVDDLPPQWVKLYGDSDASKEAWEMQKQINADIRAEARKEALDAVRSERQEEATRTEENVGRLDESFEDLSAFIGRDLTDNEQSAVLDIVDEYTPKDRNGNYAGDILPFDKAWEIYELKAQATKAPKLQERDNVAGLLGNQTQGESLSQGEQDKSWNPFDWNSYRKRI